MNKMANLVAVITLLLAGSFAFGQSYPLGHSKGFLDNNKAFSIKVSNKVFGHTEEEKASKVITFANMKMFMYSTSFVPAYGGESGGLTLMSDEPTLIQRKVGYCNIGNLDEGISIPVSVTESTVYNREIVIRGEQSKDKIAKYEQPRLADVNIFGDQSQAENGVSVFLNCDYKTNGITYVSFTAQHYGVVRLDYR